jgi:sulfide:quinone oxidoreductase
MTRQARQIGETTVGSSEPAHRVVIAGGGVAAIELLLALRAAATGRAFDVTLVAPGEWLTYRPLAVTEPFGDAPPRRYDLAGICADLDATPHRDVLAHVDAAGRVAITGGGARLSYDSLVIAAGARTQLALEGVHTFMPDDDPESLRWILRELDDGAVRTLAFVAPAASGWQLPLYELALATARHVRDRDLDGVSLLLVTPEETPLAAFRGTGSDAVARLLLRAGIEVRTDAHVAKYEHGMLWLMPGSRRLAADRVVALPRVVGPSIGGLPSDGDGFIRVDGHGRVPGLDGVYAIGDATTFPLKQGGIAAQQADVVAALVARAGGAEVELPEDRPRLRAVLFTGEDPLYLEATIGAGESVTSSASRTSPWETSGKIVARHLAPYLAAREAQRPERPTALDRERRAIAEAQARGASRG